jgi:hypothetical protein
MTQGSDSKIITGVQSQYNCSNIPLDVEFLEEEQFGCLTYGHLL